MKKRFQSALIFGAVLLSAVSLSACNKNEKSDTEIPVQSTVSEISEVSSVLDGASAALNSFSEQTELPSGAEKSGSEDEVSEQSSESSTEVSAKEVSEESKTESTAESQVSDDKDEISKEEESSVSESSSDEESSEAEGYYFDDEQIVTDYHTAQTFTDDETFNELFKENRIDKAYDEALKEVGSISEMRTVTTEYADKWKEQAETAYEKLYEILWDNADEQAKLADSQQNWKDSLEKVEEDFYYQASNDAIEGGLGSQTLLSADTAIMNYYKGRAAVLYQQIFILTGKVEIV